MEYKVQNIVRDVRVALDQNINSEALSELGDVDTLTLDEIIESKIEDAALSVVRSAPLHLLDGGKAFGDTIGWDMSKGLGSGHIVLPDDFLRLIVFQMSDWVKPVSVAIDATSPAYAQQRSRFAGVRGNPQRPVVAIVNQPVGTVLEFFSCTQGENVYIKMARYQPIPRIEVCVNEDRVIHLSEKLYRAVVYYAAYLVLLTLNDSEHAQGYLSYCKELLGTNE